MAPKETLERHISPSGVLSEIDAETIDGSLTQIADQAAEKRKFEIVWRNVIIMVILHVFFLCGLWTLINGNTKWQTNVLGKIKTVISKS